MYCKMFIRNYNSISKCRSRTCSVALSECSQSVIWKIIEKKLYPSSSLNSWYVCVCVCVLTVVKRDGYMRSFTTWAAGNDLHIQLSLCFSEWREDGGRRNIFSVSGRAPCPWSGSVHVITPASNERAGEIGSTFEEKGRILGLCCTFVLLLLFPVDTLLPTHLIVTLLF